ncbi:MAG: hypothetical protein HQL55_16890, partial [Magnetococcales bacterium]|nr:hypothetical protein [Magnetococcales bacterium]
MLMEQAVLGVEGTPPPHPPLKTEKDNDDDRPPFAPGAYFVELLSSTSEGANQKTIENLHQLELANLRHLSDKADTISFQAL